MERIHGSLQFVLLSGITLLSLILHSLILNSMEDSAKPPPIIFPMFNPLGTVTDPGTTPFQPHIITDCLSYTSVETENDLKSCEG